MELVPDLHGSSSDTNTRCSRGHGDTNDRSLLQLAAQTPQKWIAAARINELQGELHSRHSRHASSQLLNDASVEEMPKWASKLASYIPRGNPFTGRSLGAPFLFYFVCFLAIKCCMVWLVIAWRLRVCQLRRACEDLVAQQFDLGVRGITVSVEGVTVHPITAHIQFSKVTLSNPPGYESEYLLQAEQICVDIDTLKLVLGGSRQVTADCLRLSGLTATVEMVCCKAKKCVSSNIEDVLAECCVKEEERASLEMEGLSKAHHEDGPESASIAEELQLRRVIVEKVHVLQQVGTGKEGGRFKANTQRHAAVDFEFGFSEGKTAPLRLAKRLLHDVLLQVAAADSASSRHHCGFCCCCDPRHLLMLGNHPK